MLYGLVLTIHVIVCLVLIFVVLLQAGRGGGFSDMLGGGQPQSLFGTQTNAFMVKATEVCAVLFIVTSLSLGILTTQKGKSILPANLPVSTTAPAELPRIPEAVPQAPQQPPTTDLAAPAPIEPAQIPAPAAPEPAPPAAADAKTS